MGCQVGLAFRNILAALAATAQARISAEPDTDLYINGYRRGHEDALRSVALACGLLDAGGH